MKNILVTGANGFIGLPLCEELRRTCWSVKGAVRTQCQLPDAIEPVVVGSIDEVTDWSAALSKVDVVIHLAARVHVMNDSSPDALAEFRTVNVGGTLNLAMQAASVGVKRFIFISSIKVNGEFTELDQPFTEEVIENPTDAYGISKFEAEQGLLAIAKQTGMEVVIIRPPLVYGAAVKANFSSMMRVIGRGIPLPLGAIYNKRSFVYVGNLVNFILLCIDHPAATNQVFLVSDGRDLSIRELLYACADALDVKVRLFPVPQKIVEWVASLIRKRDVVQRLCGNLQVSTTKARTLLGWKPPISIADGLKATVQGLNVK